MGLNLSGPAALCGLKPLNSLSINAFSSYAYVRHFWVGAGLEW